MPDNLIESWHNSVGVAGIVVVEIAIVIDVTEVVTIVNRTQPPVVPNNGPKPEVIGYSPYGTFSTRYSDFTLEEYACVSRLLHPLMSFFSLAISSTISEYVFTFPSFPAPFVPFV